ncbi:MAG: choice-of-anchor Q domain-containing protein, partial [Solirubrobacteraceae bacterium]
LQSTGPDFSSAEPQNNGGNTNTLAPSPTSPAVDAIPTSFSFCDGADQRDIARPQGAGCDIGAVELVPFMIEATEGSQYSGPVTASLNEPIYSATIEWGDGTTASVGKVDEVNSTVSGTHTYARAGIYNGSVTYLNDGGTHKIAFQAKVAALPTKMSPSPSPSPPTPTPTPSPAPPTLTATSPPTVLTTTSAAFTATVNPDGLETEVHFEYGPVLGGASAASTGTIAYGSVTSDQPVGSDFAAHTITTTVTGLLPNVTYNVRAVASNSAGSATGPNQTLKTPADPPPPPPVLGKAVNVTPVSGVVYVELPPGATLASAASLSPFSPFALGAQAVDALTKGQAFIPLTEARQIPVGSVLETTGGIVGITTATTASKKGKQQTGDFGGGIFKLLQNRKQRGLTDLDIVDNHSAGQVCATVGKKGNARAAKLSSKTLGRVNASGHGHFAVRGQYSAATVRGTVWSVANRCEGTLTHVVRGVVSVRDFRRRKTITLFTGESYLARGPVKRG